MKLKPLLKDIRIKGSEHLESIGQITIEGIADNSTKVKNNYLFVAIEGFKTDGHDYIDDALNNGAALIVGEKPLSLTNIPYIQVENSREALGILSRNYYLHPSKNKTVIGVTGTNGKTTTSYILKHLFESAGKSCTIIGTIENIVNGRVHKSINTTPSALVLHQLLSESQDDIVIMEVSSHGLSQHRVNGIEFDYCLFTNLDNEHLDYHSSIEEYFKTKLKLFNFLKSNGAAIVNADNKWGEKSINILMKRGQKVYSVGMSNQHDIHIQDYDFESSIATLAITDSKIQINSPLAGIHNMYNIALAVQTALLLGMDAATITQSIRNFKGVKGRFETYQYHNGAKVIVDYAHTPDAFYHCLNTARQNGAKRIIHIFGFRGNRDITKRADMIKISSKLSDLYILTLDDLNAVSKNEMIQNLNTLNEKFGNEKGIIITDRTLAIKWAVEHSSADDWIIITGKGHESYQQSFLLGSECDKDTVLQVIKETLSTEERKVN